MRDLRLAKLGLLHIDYLKVKKIILLNSPTFRRGYTISIILGAAGTAVGTISEGMDYGVRVAPNPFSNFRYKYAPDAFSRKAYSVFGKEGSAILKGAKYTGKALGTLGVIVTVVDGVDNGWKSHHTADVAIGVVTTFFLSGPWGWATAAVSYETDIIVQASTGKSITEHVFD